LFSPTGESFDCYSEAQCNDAVIGYTAAQPVIVRILGPSKSPVVEIHNDWVAGAQSRLFPPDKNPCQQIPSHSILPLKVVGAGNKYYLFNSNVACADGGFFLAITVNGFGNFTYANVGCDGPSCATAGFFISLLSPTGGTLKCFSQAECDDTVIGYTTAQPVIVRIQSPTKPPDVEICNDCRAVVQVRQFPPSKNPCQRIPGFDCLPLNVTGAGNKYYLFNSTGVCADGGFFLAVTVNGFGNFTYANVGCDGPSCAEEGFYLSLLSPTGKSLECYSENKCDDTVIGYTAAQPVIVRVNCTK
jgi:hypothetical protein